MNSTIKTTVAYLSGVATGIAASWIIANYIFKIEWVNEAEPAKDRNEDAVLKNDGELHAAIASYSNIEDNSDYVSYNKVSSESQENDIPEPIKQFDDPTDKPYICSSEEFGIDVDYDEIELYFYDSNETLTDCWNYPIEDVEMTVGTNVIESFKSNPELDAIYVKNDRLKAYYEVTRQSDDHPDISG